MLDNSTAQTIPVIQDFNKSSILEHEATTSNLSEEQLEYLATRGCDEDKGTKILVNGFRKEIFQKLPLEFAPEAKQLMDVSLEGAVG